MKRGHTATVGGPEGRKVRAQFTKHPKVTDDPGKRDRTLPQSTPLIDTSFRLEDVERVTRESGYCPLGRLGDVWANNGDGTGYKDGNAHAALYEALTNWLNLPDCGVCGVPYEPFGVNANICSLACWDEHIRLGMD